MHNIYIYTQWRNQGSLEGIAPRPLVSSEIHIKGMNKFGWYGPSMGALKCCKVVFVLQILSRIAVDEVFIHYFEKMLASGGFAPRPLLGFWPGTPLGDFLPSDPFIVHSWKKKSCGAHGSLLVIIPNIAPDLLHYAIILLWNKKGRLQLATVRIISTLYSKKCVGQCPRQQHNTGEG